MFCCNSKEGSGSPAKKPKKAASPSKVELENNENELKIKPIQAS